MTQKEIKKFLANTKVYVNGKSKEIQEKLFSLGYKWGGKVNKVYLTEEPFLFIHHNHKEITWGHDMQEFTTHDFREITAEEVLSLELREPTYRPFKNREECWNEMLKHHPFGWIKNTEDGDYYPIRTVYNKMNFKDLLSIYQFADGTPIGVKED